MPNELKQYAGLSVHFGCDLKTKPHAHHALEVVLALDGLLTVRGEHLLKSEGVIIRPNALHTISGTGQIISVFLDPETVLCSELVSMLGAKDIAKLEPHVTQRLITYFDDRTSHHLIESGIYEMLTQTIASGNMLSSDTGSQIDPRISEVIKLIKSSPQKTIPFKTLTRISELSESRLMHLFKKETGTTIRRFILWIKLQHAIRLYLLGNSLKKSASLSGFADAAHFNRVFVSNFGINPSRMLKPAP